MLGIIASSAAQRLGEELNLHELTTVVTEWGSVRVRMGHLEGRRVACIARHGEQVSLPPHAINYRANIAALAHVGCTGIIATNAVGSLHPEIAPGQFCIPSQIIDFTHGRTVSFFDERMVNVDFTNPYCERLSRLLLSTMHDLGYEAHVDKVYACMQGPRFETAAEIKMLRLLGADIVGMTAMPEAALAREKGLCYASLCVVTNLAAGIEGHHPSHEEVSQVMAQQWRAVTSILSSCVGLYTDDSDCPCHSPSR